MTDTPSVTFMFTGQGSQFPGMGKELYDNDESFKALMDKCNEIYKSIKGDDSDLLNILFTGSEEELEKTSISQPAIVAVEYCLAQTLIERNVRPTIVVGHSVGEIAAACIAGAMSIETALELAIKRGELMMNVSSTDGVMYAVRQSMANANFAMNAVCDKMEQRNKVGIAAINGPRSITLSGSENSVNKILKRLDASSKQLKVSHAFHSPLMKEMEDDFRKVLVDLGTNIGNPLTIPLSSTVTGKVMDVGQSLSLEHWVDQVSQTVLYQKAFQLTYGEKYIGMEGKAVVVEVGPKMVLGTMSKGLYRPKEKPLWAEAFAGDSPDKLTKTIEEITKRISDDA